ncbi:MAG TPA: hypothetical protein VIH59_02715 [Candidatus Tectomicrobia bacterium]
MTHDERDEYGAEAQDMITGLRRLAQTAEAPPDLLATVMARGAQLLPPGAPPRGVLGRWGRALAARWPRPIVWGPALAVACYMAGVFLPPPPLRPALQQPVSVLPDTIRAARRELTAKSLSRDQEARSPAPPAMPFPERQRGSRQQAAPASPAAEQVGVLASRVQLAPSSPAQMEVTTTLSPTLYKWLTQEAQRRQTDLSTILRDAVEAYGRGKEVQD